MRFAFIQQSLAIIALFICTLSYAQQSTIDSLQFIFRNGSDSAKTESGLRLLKQYRDSDYEKAKQIATQLNTIRRNTSSSLLQTKICLGLGIYKEFVQEYDSALYYLQKSIQTARPDKDQRIIASAHNSKGIVFEKKGEYMKAVQEYLSALKLFEQNKMAQGEVLSHNNIGVVYKNLGNYDLAIKHYTEALRILKQNGQENELLLLNLGGLYDTKKRYKEAEDYIQSALKIAMKRENYVIVMKCYSNLTAIKLELGENAEAEKYFKKLEQLVKKSNNKEMSLSLETTRALLLSSKGGSTDSVLLQLNKSFNQAEALNSDAARIEVLSQVVRAYESKGDFKNAYYTLDSLVKINSRVFSDKQTQQIADMQTQYDTQKKENEIKVLNKLSELDKEKIKSQNIVLVLMGLVFLVVAISSVVLYRALSAKKKANQLLEIKNKEIEEQKLIVEEKQREVIDSIRYAKRIQNALITNEHYIRQNLKRLR